MDQDEVIKWNRKIRLALAYRKPKEEVWMRTIDYLKSKMVDPKKQEDEDQICVNIVHPHVRVVVPAVYSRNPDVLVRPMQEDAAIEVVRKRANVMQKVLRYLIKEVDIKSTVKLCCLDAVLTGGGWAKSGYETQFYDARERQEEEAATVVEKLLGAIGLGKEEEEEDEDEFLRSLKIIEEMPWSLRVSPFDMIEPALTRTPDQRWWLAERIILPFYKVKDNPDYDTDTLKPSANANQLLRSMQGYSVNLPGGDEEEYSVLYELYDSDTHMVYTFADDHKKVLQEKPCEYTFLDGRFHPYRQLRFNEIPDEIYPTGDIEPAEAQIEELNEIRTQINRHRKRFNRKYLAKPGVLSEEGKAALKTNEDGVVIELEGVAEDKPVSDCVAAINDAQLSQEVYSMRSDITSDLFLILGTNDYAASGAEGSDSATEAAIRAGRSRLRVDERIDTVGDFVTGLIKDMAQIIQRFMDHDQIARIVGEKDAMFWRQIDVDEDIRDDLYYSIFPGSTTPTNKDVDLAKFEKFVATYKDDPYIDQVKLRLEHIRRIELENPESYLASPVQIQILEEQRQVAMESGMFLPRLINPSGSNESLGRVPDPSKRQSGPSSNPRNAGAPRKDGQPSTPGGRGGTALVRNG